MRRCLAVLTVALISAPSPADGQGTVAIRNVTIISMVPDAPAARGTVMVRDGRIAEIGPPERTRVPEGATVVDGTGKYLIPGLFEMHAHTSKSRASSLGLYVLHGVTTIRDQGSEHAEVLRWRREIRAGTRVGPRMLIAGPYLESLRNIERMRRDPPESRVEPFERARIPVGTPADARRIVDSLASLELDHFKIRTVQDRATYLALARAAHGRGKRLTGHVVSASPALFLEAGQDGVDHGFPPTLDSLPREDRMAFWRTLAQRDVGVVPTLVTVTASVFRPLAYFRALVSDSQPAVHPLRPYLSAFLLQDWREQVEEVTPERVEYFRGAWPVALKHVREMRDAGVRLLAGSDVAVLNVFPGGGLHQELRLLVDSVGMSPLEALASATRKPAEWLGLADSVGTIAAGKVADLVLLDADPLADITNTGRISAVVLRGRLFRRGDLDALLAGVAAMPDLRVNDWIR
ncbi:MAG TPA: amidohydrolase family protein [Gemmatimonadales bacterium]|nr:amidohydrolase family protein [Gemmatimonadales bacterium]